MYVSNFVILTFVFSFFCTGEELVPKLQRVVYSDAATLPEAGLRQTAHRLQ